MGIVDKIKELENEYARRKRTRPPRATSASSRPSSSRGQLLQDQAGSGGGGGARRAVVGRRKGALIGFPSVGKSSLLSTLTTTQSEAAGHEFTTLTCIPGNIIYNDTRIQLLTPLHHRGRGPWQRTRQGGHRRGADLGFSVIVLDAAKEGVDNHKMILERSRTVGLRLKLPPPNITLTKKATGGVKFNARYLLPN